MLSFPGRGITPYVTPSTGVASPHDAGIVSVPRKGRTGALLGRGVTGHSDVLLSECSPNHAKAWIAVVYRHSNADNDRCLGVRPLLQELDRVPGGGTRASYMS
jgi:hypothetical protein